MAIATTKLRIITNSFFIFKISSLNDNICNRLVLASSSAHREFESYGKSFTSSHQQKKLQSSSDRFREHL
ncbi:hypothetical protein KFK09_011288 [Dendrobium nobile]|uniref:Uncharacterized protein n=1 Tax=Dendrobium nobile TaxID=94219 RepID=A0A8T3BC80_DENNO|nr:hypothetical protein KFK09_011288 [Dendrobium nobile]